MSNFNMKRCFAVASVALFGMVHSMSALALGTGANTPIDNFATVDYQVGGASQTAVPSNTTSFVVDQVVDLTVAEADGAETPVVPNQLDAVARFTVTNTGNEVQDFSLSAIDTTGTLFGVTDNFNPTAYTIVVDVNDNNTYEPLIDTATFINELGPDVTGVEATDNVISVFVLADIPVGQIPNDGALVTLTAEAREGGDGGAQGIVQAETGGNNTDGLEVVWANNTSSDDDAYLVGAVASLAAVKSSEVVSDPLGNSAPVALAIPGAVVEYTVTITNTGAADATNVEVSDILQADLTFETGNYDVGVSDSDVQIDALGVTSYCIAEAGGVDTNTDGCVLTGTTLTVGAAGMTAEAAGGDDVVTVQFQVSIN